MTVRIQRWEPENIIFWLTRGRRIANRNLLLSTLALHLNFNVWMMWSIVVANLPAIGFSLSGQQQFLLVSIPPLVGAIMRIFYATIWSWVGGGTWLGVSSLFLLLPALGVGHLVQDITTPFPLLLLVAALCGIGGAASSSHLSNTSFFFPKAAKGFAMGLNAGLGNLGVSVVQIVVPLAIAAPLFGALAGDPQIWGIGAEVHPVWLQNAGYIWIAPILLISALCFLYAHDLPKLKLTLADQWQMMKERHTWYICLLYLSSYGTFIGFSAAFPLLSRKLFPLVDATPYLFIGPMMCALARPVGGWCGDRIGGGVTTLVCNLAMALGTLGILAALPSEQDGGSFPLFLCAFQLIFLAAGVGNGSSYQLSPKVFLIEAGRLARERGDSVAAAYARGGRRGVAAMSISSVTATLGGFFIPKSFGSALDLFNSFVPAFMLFLAFYLLSMAVAWWQYGRSSAPMHC
ncbi:MFS transporter [uncultured Aquitalea sp.]|uniref:MFS transporter n=1 Tax=uncultured Aquitalea sp. TaxID=540272 RepID=UPI0025F70ADA|nr:MFS transporter [uncultured Aquitalea sp.]